MKRLIRYLLIAVLLIIGVLYYAAKKETHQAVFYIVRHAEKADSSTMQNVKNPELSVEGKGRAQLLATMLSNENLSALYSTDYIRTRETLAPLSKETSIPVTLYQPRMVNTLLDSLVSVGNGKNFVICGHSNTVLPMITHLKGVLPQQEITENEYDKLFKVTVKADTTIVERSIF
jgi:2,3-bisphosphoglycerate-dependent phosphoglycerate mutase